MAVELFMSSSLDLCVFLLCAAGCLFFFFLTVLSYLGWGNSPSNLWPTRAAIDLQRRAGMSHGRTPAAVQQLS